MPCSSNMSVGKNEESKKWSQFLATSAANVAIFTMGLHTGWPGPSLPKILSDEFPYDVSNEAGSYITIVGNLGTVFGGLMGSLLLDRIGRRRTMLLI
ncbi:hypothetical protein MTP99_005572, partial [Tenebrio molitor]